MPAFSLVTWDFELNNELKMNVLNLLEEVLRDPDLLPQERKATANILSFAHKLRRACTVSVVGQDGGGGEGLEEHEALSQDDQDDIHLKLEDIIQMMSNLVASQIMNYADISSRANAIEKWVAVADICRCLHNYNGVLEITAALNRSAIYRLKKTWAKVSKQ
ncbi:hypothetical protein A6R68_05486, partial [Neotoma lepida]